MKTVLRLVLAVVLLMAQSLYAAQAPTPKKETTDCVVVDSSGKQVGDKATCYGDVFKIINGRFVLVRTQQSGFATSGFNTWYQSNNCSGQAYMLDDIATNNSMINVGTVDAQGILHYPSGASGVDGVTILSVSFDGSCSSVSNGPGIISSLGTGSDQGKLLILQTNMA